jgi:flavin-dependent trigonelline monooxygenase, oxygenase component
VLLVLTASEARGLQSPWLACGHDQHNGRFSPFARCAQAGSVSSHRVAAPHREIGTPEQVIERLRYYEQLGVDEFSFWCDNSLPHNEKRKSLELFIKEVTPAFV